MARPAHPGAPSLNLERIRVSNLTHRFRGLFAALMLAFCLVFVAACGGDDKKSSSSDTTAAEEKPAATTEATTEEAAPPADAGGDFVAEANALCEAAKADLQPLAQAEDTAGIITRSAQLTDEIAALQPPPELQDSFDQLIELARGHDDEARRIVEDGGTIEDLAALTSEDADALATDMGLTGCV
jgi:hypothetical protein